MHSDPPAASLCPHSHSPCQAQLYSTLCPVSHISGTARLTFPLAPLFLGTQEDPPALIFSHHLHNLLF